jgi:hypothetical protein
MFGDGMEQCPPGKPQLINDILSGRETSGNSRFDPTSPTSNEINDLTEWPEPSESKSRFASEDFQFASEISRFASEISRRSE